MFKKERLRRTMMFIPGNKPGMLADAHIYGADSLMFDLEDSVARNQKDAARALVYEAISSLDYGGTEIVVRINNPETEVGRADIKAMILAGADVLRMPKTDSADDIRLCDRLMGDVEKEYGLTPGQTGLMAAIESANGVFNSRDIATASERMIGIALGAEDFCADMKCQRTLSGVELQMARQMIVLAARAAGIAALDTVYSNINNEEQLIYEAKLVKEMGFDGKSIINPRQIEPIHNIFAPTAKEIEKAERIMRTIEEAEKMHSGVASMGGEMVDRPVVLRAMRVVALAKACGLISEEA